jgi:hypothetical protein
MLSRHITNDKWLDGKSMFIGKRICIEQNVINGYTWSFCIEYVGPTLMCVTYVDDKVKDMFPLSRLYL